ncbi:MAG: hypothetical protein J6M07_05795, partial [Ruminococcus sp.]|nr:hypothetical protein [Ruminococcus sp.]
MITKGMIAGAVLSAAGIAALCSCTADSDLIHVVPYIPDSSQCIKITLNNIFYNYMDRLKKYFEIFFK